MSELKGLVVDYGGVLTNTLEETMAAWAEADGLDVSEFGGAMKKWLGSSYGEQSQTNPVHALERGELEMTEFEQGLASRLKTRDGRPIAADGLLGRMFAGFQLQPLMLDALRRSRAGGVKTALLSNSWGMDYPREGWDELFDAVVISAEVGMRKPEPEIFLHTAKQLGLPPEQCAMVDDIGANVKGAVAVGMVGVHHVDPERTVEELERLLGLSLR
ncbi:MAG: hydrolase [Frankiales bacterium]|nr:hydrolase [Frankiales bacterium]